MAGEGPGGSFDWLSDWRAWSIGFVTQEVGEGKPSGSHALRAEAEGEDRGGKQGWACPRPPSRTEPKLGIRVAGQANLVRSRVPQWAPVYPHRTVGATEALPAFDQ